MHAVLAATPAPRSSTPPLDPAVAYGVIAGLSSYVAIHLPFWTADYVRRRWGKGSRGEESPRHLRQKRRWAAGGGGKRRAPLACVPCVHVACHAMPRACSTTLRPVLSPNTHKPALPHSPHRRSKTGYHMRKTFGPAEGPPSRADSFVGAPGYQDSYHSQDSRRSALPVHMLMGGGGPAAGMAGSVGGSIYGGMRGSNPPSVVNLHFPAEGSQRGPGAGGGAGAQLRIGQYGMSSVSQGAGEGPRDGACLL